MVIKPCYSRRNERLRGLHHISDILPFVLARYAEGHEPHELSRGKQTAQNPPVGSDPQFTRLGQSEEPNASDLHQSCLIVV
jgi:hypothetical protein